jgi:hypothetical protein
VAVRVNASTDGLSRSTGLLNYNAAYTLMGWFWRVSDRATYEGVLVLDGGAFKYDGIWVNGSNVLEMYASAGTDVFTTGGTVATGAWHHIAMVRESTTALKLYLNGAQSGSTVTNDVSARSAITGMYSLANGTTTEWLDGRVASLKAWTRALTLSEVQSEQNTIRPRDATSLYGWWTLFPGSGERVRDYSGNGRDWTETGTLTDEDGPPVSYRGPRLWVPQAPAVAAGGTPNPWSWVPTLGPLLAQ